MTFNNKWTLDPSSIHNSYSKHNIYSHYVALNLGRKGYPLTRFTDSGDMKRQQRISRGRDAEALQLCFGADALPAGKIWRAVSQRALLGGWRSPWTAGLGVDTLQSCLRLSWGWWLPSAPGVSAHLWASPRLFKPLGPVSYYRKHVQTACRVLCISHELLLWLLSHQNKIFLPVTSSPHCPTPCHPALHPKVQPDSPGEEKVTALLQGKIAE